jgi:hypothetical protein
MNEYIILRSQLEGLAQPVAHEEQALNGRMR